MQPAIRGNANDEAVASSIRKRDERRDPRKSRVSISGLERERDREREKERRVRTRVN